MADGVAWSRKDVERAVPEEVVGWNSPKFQSKRCIVELAHRVARELCLLDTALRICRVSWSVSLHEPGPNDHLCAGIKRGQIAPVVEMVMRPDDRGDGFGRDSQVPGVRVKNLINIRLHGERHDLLHEANRRRREESLPVLAHAQVEQYVLTLVVIADEDRVRREHEGLVPGQLRRKYHSRSDLPISCRVNDAHVYRGRRFGDAQLWHCQWAC